MAGDWLKIEANTPDKPEVFDIAAQLKISTPEALGRLFLVWRLFDKETEDGNAATVTSAYVDHVAGVTGFADAMRAVGWLSGGEGGKHGISLPNFDLHNGKTSKSRALTARRVATHKKRSSNGEVTQRPLPREEKRRVSIRAPKPDAKSLVALGVGEQTALDWLAVRKAKRAPLTETALEDLQREAKKAGISVAEAVSICARKSWQGFNASWNWQDAEKPADAKLKVAL